MRITRFVKVEGVWQVSFIHEGRKQEVWSNSLSTALAMAIHNANTPLGMEMI